MLSRPRSFLFLLLTGLLLWTCDTTLNIKSPTSHYFLKYFGGEGSQYGTDFIVNPDGTFVLFGTSQMANSLPQFYLVKTDAQGKEIKSVTFGEPTSTCQARDIELASDGRIVVLGNMTAVGRTDNDVLIKTFNPDLSETSNEYFGGFTDVNTGLPADEDATTVSQTNDGFIVAGSSGKISSSTQVGIVREALYLRVTDDLKDYVPPPPAGWPTAPGTGQGPDNVSTRIVQVPASATLHPLEFYVFGYSRWSQGDNNPPDYNFWYFILNVNGVPNAATPSIPSSSDGKEQKLFSVAYDANQLSDGFFLGGLETDPNTNKICIAKLRYPLAFGASDIQLAPRLLPEDKDLGKIATVLNPPRTSNEFVSACPSKPNGYLILTNEATTPNNNLYLMKVTAAGEPVWSTPVIYGGAGDDFAGSVQELSDGRIVVFGTMTVGQASGSNSETKMVLIKVNQDGQFSD